MKENKTLTKWKNVIDNKLKYENAPFSEKEVIYLRKAIGASGLKSMDDRQALINHFTDNMPADGYNITVDHQQKGIEYLLKNTFKLNGEPRKGCMLGSFEREVIKNFAEFKFVDLYYVQGGYYLPLYKCIDKQGNSFTYTGNVYSMILITQIDVKRLRAV